jgi:uncharacterized protein YegP (UPF0339 family)
MSTTETTPLHRLEVYQDNRGEWRWRVYGPEKHIVLQSGLAGYTTRDVALGDANEVLENAGLPSWTTRLDGITRHDYDLRNLPRIDPIKEARDAGIKPADPAATEKAQAALAELEAKRVAAEETLEKERVASPTEGVMEDVKETKRPAARTKKTTEEADPIAAQRARSDAAKG